MKITSIELGVGLDCLLAFYLSGSGKEDVDIIEYSLFLPTNLSIHLLSDDNRYGNAAWHFILEGERRLR